MAREHHHDPTFYRSPRDAAAGPPEKLAYVAAFSRPATEPDGIFVVGTDPDSPSYGQVAGFTELPNTGDELHHFGWNACSSALCPTGSHTHGDRRYLVVPGIRSSRPYIPATQEHPTAPPAAKVLEAGDLGKQGSYPRPHTVRCGPRPTTPTRSTGSWAWWSASRTCRPRSGCGTTTTASGTPPRSSRSRPSPRPPSSSRRCSRASGRCRRWSPTSPCRWTTGSCTCRAGAPAR